MRRQDAATRRRSRYWTSVLIWESCRRQVRVGTVRAALEAGAEVDTAVGVAVQHRIAALLWRALDAADCTDVLGDRRGWLSDLAHVHRLEADLLLPRAVHAAVQPLTEAGLEPVILKGPVVAARYPETGLRRMEDIDLLLPRRQHIGAIRALEAAGWRVVRHGGRDRYDTVLCHPAVPTLALELHYGLEAWYQRVTRLDPDALWERRVPVECLGTAAFGLPLPEELVTLAVHAGKPFHGFHHLVWIADLAMITGDAAEHDGDVDWERVAGLARQGKCTTVVACALALARRVGVEVPEGLLPVPQAGWRGAALGPILGIMWPLDHDHISTFHMRFALADTFWRRLTLLVGCGHKQTIDQRLRYSVGAPAQAARRLYRLRRQAPAAVVSSKDDTAAADASRQQRPQPQQVPGGDLA